MLQGSTTAKLLLGFVVLLGIIFFGVAVFGKYNMNLGVYGIMILAVVGTALATLMKLFSVGILLLVITGVVLLVIMKNMFFKGDENR